MLGYFNLFRDKFINLVGRNYIVCLVANYSLVKYSWDASCSSNEVINCALRYLGHGHDNHLMEPLLGPGDCYLIIKPHLLL